MSESHDLISSDIMDGNVALCLLVTLAGFQMFFIIYHFKDLELCCLNIEDPF